MTQNFVEQNKLPELKLGKTRKTLVFFLFLFFLGICLKRFIYFNRCKASSRFPLILQETAPSELSRLTFKFKLSVWSLRKWGEGEENLNFILDGYGFVWVFHWWRNCIGPKNMVVN